jgi:hypothetical protein
MWSLKLAAVSDGVRHEYIGFTAGGDFTMNWQARRNTALISGMDTGRHEFQWVPGPE